MNYYTDYSPGLRIPKMARYNCAAGEMKDRLKEWVNNKRVDCSKIPKGYLMEAKSFFSELDPIFGPKAKVGIQLEQEKMQNKSYKIARYLLLKQHITLEGSAFEKILRRMMAFMKDLKKRKKLTGKDLETAEDIRSFFAAMAQIGGSEYYNEMMERSHAGMD